jgi:primosomal replication protein N
VNADALNLVKLTGEITAIEPLRHTPAGLPLMHFTFLHRSLQVEANIERQTEFEVDAVAIGEVTAAVSRFQPGSRVTLQGFLAARRRSGVQIRTQLVLHITHITQFTHSQI